MYEWICKFCRKIMKNNVINKENNTVHFHCDICNEEYEISIKEVKIKNQ